MPGRRETPACALVLVLGAACKGTTASDASDGAVLDASADAGAGVRAPGAYGIRCSVFARDLAAGETTHQTADVVVVSTVDGTARTSVHGISFAASIEPVENATGTARLRVSVAEAGVVQEMLIDRLQPPPYEYAGFTGFTGLMYVPTGGLDVQYLCSAAAKSAPPPIGPASSAAVHVKCIVRHGPSREPGDGGADATADAGRADDAGGIDEEEVLDLLGAGERTIPFRDGAVRLIVDDSPYEGRTAVIQILPGSAVGGGGFDTQQALQLDHEHAFPNLFGTELG